MTKKVLIYHPALVVAEIPTPFATNLCEEQLKVVTK